MQPKELVMLWVDAFNSGDAYRISEFYAEDAINHQVANEPVKGKTEITEMFKKEFSAAKMECIIESVFQDGNWAILEWKDPLGLRGCGFFHVLEGKIIFQRGYWDKLSFLKAHNLPIPD